MGHDPQRLRVADLDADGNLDVVTTAGGSHHVVLLFGRSPGVGFDDPVSVDVRILGGPGTAGRSPRGLAVADVDDDGVLDVVTSSPSDNDVSVLLGQGDRQFAAPQAFETYSGYKGSSPQALALDVVTVNHGTDDVAVLRGFGDGRFSESRLESLNDDPRDVEVGDFNNDGRLDWVVVHRNQQTTFRGLQLLSGAYDRRSDSARDGGSGELPDRMAVGHVNNDLFLDLMTLSDHDNHGVVKLNNGGGNFSGNGGVTTTRGRPSDVALVDVNGDGGHDFLVADFNDDVLSVWLSNGAGGFGGRTDFTTRDGGAGQRPMFLQVAEVTGDDHVDLITANQDSNDVSVLPGAGDGSFGAPIIVPATFDPGSNNVRCVRVFDMDGDDLSDLVTANYDRSTVSVMLSFDEGRFAAPQEFSTGASPYRLAVADLDDDGLGDIVTVDHGTDAASVLMGLGHQAPE